MGFESGIGLGLYVSGLVLFIRTLEESFPKKKTARWASIITLIVLGVLFMFYNQ